ncbi:protein Wnt-2 isoform X1 [Bactrocera tryoni]|nr:protein Wnt-2 isoform X1 [Bactrocera tryoni]XP_039956645.1 protein Wnt-2 isoform X1 [Bactrocera tryoni]XP_039956646.1 protein Wnt-2 isoform X1 [Bactrocera tryoni]XP_039956647.1 protein Wnt-2 isoform X1 [Bactrocera tryoni]XP_039956648.1 protein Wnt-2 isoform X1 [Bactrocera tryoni]XP_039956649.1 protein Wnt-2 isoform X1 [Bactrocera tryoni]XP_039956650.1 protein Wnt-2 isoform X1 [Bactrocera tryoni]
MWKNRNKLLIFLLWIMEIRLVSSFTSAILCSRIPGLTPQQRQLCSESPDALIALGEAHQMGSHECQHQFRGHRWNCSQVWQEGVFGHVMFVGSREAAFTYAIASAGAAHSVTAACARGNISLCGCDMRHKPNSDSQSWKWGGCSADINFGMKFARKFLDAREIEGDARTLMNLHNNRVGRRLVKNLLKTECKCHGVSGSCEMKTCWKSLPPFRQIGEVLMRKYKRAKHVHVKDVNGLKQVLRERNSSRELKRMELVYLQKSPDYCERNVQQGILGTTGRVCNRTSSGTESCDKLCCGRGYNTRQVRRRAQCRCKFRWCCDVTCDVCEENYEEFTCK